MNIKSEIADMQINCSEAVFRIYTEDPMIVKEILQGFADEIAQNTGEEAQEIPEFIDLKDYLNKTLLYCCAGLGDNNVVVTHEPDKKAIRINIGNNDIDGGIVSGIIKSHNLKAEEAEVGTNDLNSFARDCTCGNQYGISNEPKGD